jgi:hypothetical protein
VGGVVKMKVVIDFKLEIEVPQDDKNYEVIDGIIKSHEKGAEALIDIWKPMFLMDINESLKNVPYASIKFVSGKIVNDND